MNLSKKIGRARVALGRFVSLHLFAPLVRICVFQRKFVECRLLKIRASDLAIVRVPYFAFPHLHVSLLDLPRVPNGVDRRTKCPSDTDLGARVNKPKHEREDG